MKKWMKRRKAVAPLERNSESSASSDSNDSQVPPGALPIGFYLEAPEETDDEDGFFDWFEDEKINLFDENTLLGQISMIASVQTDQRVTDEFNQEAAKNGAKILSQISSVPLSTFWQKFTEIFLIVIFFGNIVAMAYDLYLSPVYLYYKVTALVMSLIENLVAWAMALISKHPKIKNSPNKDQIDKVQQYVENILHELLLCPLIIISVIGFSNDKMYQKPKNVYGWILITLLAIDLIDISWTQLLRVKMVFKLFRDIEKILRPGESSSPSARRNGALLPRFYVSIVGNNFVFAVLMVMLGCQINKDNYTSSDYTITLESGILMASMIVYPIFSLILFIIVNSYWVMELFISLSLALGESKQIDFENSTVADAMNFAVSQTNATKKRLEKLLRVPGWKKFFYSLSELPILGLIIIWGSVSMAIVYFFDGFDDMWLNLSIKLVFLLVTVLANGHLSIVALCSVVYVVVLGLAAVVYPVTVLVCCRKKPNVDGTDFEDV